MGDLPPHTAGVVSRALKRPAWPLLATTFLIGIGLVSLADIVTEDTLDIPALELPERLRDMPLALVAPGWEDVLEAIPNPERVELLAPWDPLPARNREWVLARPQWEALPRLPDGTEVVSEEEAGDWVLTVLRPLHPAPPSQDLDLMTQLRNAEVAFVHPDGSESRCDQWRFDRWTCDLEDWLWVGPVELAFRDRTRQCLWAHPRSPDALVIRFPDVPLGTRIAGRYGLSDQAADTPDGAPVELTVRAGDSERTFTAENRRGFFSYQLDTQPSEGADVVFSVRAERDGRRHFCFNASVRGLVATLSPPDQAPPGEAVPDEAATDEAATDEAPPGEGAPGETAPEGAAPEEPGPNPRALQGEPLREAPRLELRPGARVGTGEGQLHFAPRRLLERRPRRGGAGGEGSGSGSGQRPEGRP